MNDNNNQGGYPIQEQSDVTHPKENKEYLNPTWGWWLNENNTWNCTAKFVSTDGKDIQKVDASAINYEEGEENGIHGTFYTAEVTFNDKDYTSPKFFVGAADPDGMLEAGRGETTGEEDDKVIPFPGNPDSTGEEAQGEGDTAESEEPEKAIDDPENPLSDMSEMKINRLLRELQEGVKMMEGIWNTTRTEFGLTDGMMRELYKYNTDHCEKMPDGLSDEDKEKWDYFNGLDEMTEEDVVKIFGEDSKLIGVDHGVTMSRVKEAANDLFAWTYALREYTNVHNAYMALIEEEEEKYIQELKSVANAEEDPEKRKAMLGSIDFYYYRKRLGFLGNPDEITPEVRARIHRAWKDERKIEYWLKRSREKLGKIKISTKAILEISKFESRFLPEKYHKIDNALLTYFLNICTYCKPDDKKDAGRNMVVCMVFALDQLIRNVMPDAVKEEVMKNILIFEEMMYKEIIGDEPPAPEADPQSDGPASESDKPAEE